VAFLAPISLKSQTKDEWTQGNPNDFYKNVAEKTGFPIVIRPANQGSSIGVAIIDEGRGEAGFSDAVNAAFFRLDVTKNEWTNYSKIEKIQFLRRLGDIREGIGFPVNVVHPPTPSKGGDTDASDGLGGGRFRQLKPSTTPTIYYLFWIIFLRKITQHSPSKATSQNKSSLQRNL